MAAVAVTHYLITWRDAIANIIEIVENIIGQIHVGDSIQDALLRDASQLGLIGNGIKRNDHILVHDIWLNDKFTIDLISKHIGREQ